MSVRARVEGRFEAHVGVKAVRNRLTMHDKTDRRSSSCTNCEPQRQFPSDKVRPADTHTRQSYTKSEIVCRSSAHPVPTKPLLIIHTHRHHTDMIWRRVFSDARELAQCTPTCVDYDLLLVMSGNMLCVWIFIWTKVSARMGKTTSECMCALIANSIAHRHTHII